MKNIIILLSTTLILFSCQQKTQIKKKNSVITKDTILKKEVKADTIITKKEEPQKIVSNEGPVVMLPNNRYAVIILDSYLYEDKHRGIKEWLNKPKEVKVFDIKTKKQIPETRLDNYYAEVHQGDNDVDNLYYGDFNFDGKMDVACIGISLGYRNFGTWNFYLATSKGYKFSKSFSEIMNHPIAYFKLDSKNKKFIAYRKAEWDWCMEYKVTNNKAKLVKFISEGERHGPIKNRHVTIWQGKKEITTNTPILNPYNIEEILSFKIENNKRKVMLFYNTDSDMIGNSFYYLSIKNDSIIDYEYSDNFDYDAKNNTLVFKDKNKTYKVYDGKTKIGVEIKDNRGRVINLIGDIKSKKGSISRIISLKRDE